MANDFCQIKRFAGIPQEGKMSMLFSAAVGGSLGAGLRYAISDFFNKLPSTFPLGTLFSNVLAGFLIGFIVGLERGTASLPSHVKTLLTTGFLGGLSTFSTFSLDTISLFEKRHFFLMGANIALNVCLSIVFAVLGMELASLIVKAK
jgi:CrcB protein